MQLFRQLRSADRNQPIAGRKIRGLSTAELVGIIVIVGILGALATTYFTGLISQAKSNAGNQNAQSLNTTLSCIIAAGGTVNTSSPEIAIASLNAGITVGSGAAAVTYRVNPPILNPGSYSLSSTTNLFSYVSGEAP